MVIPPGGKVNPASFFRVHGVIKLKSAKQTFWRNPESWPVSIFDLYFWKLAHMILRNISAKARMVLVSSLWNAVIRNATSLMAQANRRIISSHIAEKSTHDEIVKALRKMTINYPNKMTLFSPGLLLGQDSNPIKNELQNIWVCSHYMYVNLDYRN